MMDMCEKITFTGEDITVAMERISTDNASFFELLTELGQATKSIITSKTINVDDKADFISSCLIAKAMNTFESIIRLCKAGFISEAAALTRILLEETFIMCFIEKDPGNIDKYLNANKHEDLRRLKNIIEHPEYFSGLINDEEMEHIKQLKKQIADDIARNSIAKKNVKNWAENVGMHKAYVVTYGLFSEDVHIDPRALERFLTKNDDGIVTKIDLHFVDLYELKHLLYTCLDLFLKLLSSYINIRGLDSTPLNSVIAHRNAIGGSLID